MASKKKLKAATNDFFMAFQKEPRLDGEAETSELERVAILAKIADDVAKQHGINSDDFVGAISAPVFTLKAMMDAKTANASAG